MTDILELPFPHGFLIQRGKQIAIASDVKLDIDKPFLVVSDGDVFGDVVLSEPAEMTNSEFDRKQWVDKHRMFPRERRQLWPDAEKLYVHPISGWEPLETPKIFVGGEVVDEPQLTATQQQIAFKSKQLPKQIILTPDVVAVTEIGGFILDPLVQGKSQLENALIATFETDIEISKATEFMPVYSLALVRNPRMRMAKKNEISIGGYNYPVSLKNDMPENKIAVASSGDVAVIENVKQEEEAEHMPWRIEIRDGQHCVIREDDGEVEDCHETRPQAVAQLQALSISEEERSVHEDVDKPPKRRRKPKKEVEVKVKWVEKLKSAATALADLLKVEENKEMDFPEDMFKNDSGFAAIKTASGELWHITWSANAFKDRDGEIFSTKSLEQYVSENEHKVQSAAEKGKTESLGFFNFWHIPHTDFAEKKWQAVAGKFLVEAGPYLDNEIGRSASNFFSEFANGHPEFSPEGWGCSVEFKFKPEERVKGVYDWVWITRTSTLPRSVAANIWTETKQENIMSPEQKASLTAMTGNSELADSIEDLGIKITQDLEDANIASKKTQNETQDESQQPVTEISLDMGELAKAVSEHINIDLGAVGEVMATLATSVKQNTEDVAQLKKGIEVKTQTETPRFTFNLQQAKNADETVIEDDDDLKDKKPQEKNKVNGDMAAHYFGNKS